MITILFHSTIMPDVAMVRNSRSDCNESYRGGWSTSLSALFQDPSSKSDCCALACCGVLLSDRNYYLALDEPPPPWWKRLGKYFGLPILVATVYVVCSKFLPTTDSKHHLKAMLVWILFVLLVALLTKAKHERIRVRRAVMTKLHNSKFGTITNDNTLNSSATAGTTNNQVDDSDEDAVHGIVGTSFSPLSIESYIPLHQHDDIRKAHAVCACFGADGVYVQNNDDTLDDSMDEPISNSMMVLQERPPADLCHCLWSTLLTSCCGYLCGAWWVCCGMCAISQEDRELRRLLPKKDLQVDYITFEPYVDYMNKLQDLRLNQVKSLWMHGKAISQLSRKLVTILGLTLILLTFVALSNLDAEFHVLNLAVLIATFSQAFIIVYLVHWNRNRFNLSLDAVIKYFSSGFVLCTFIVIVYEMMVLLVLEFFMLLILVCGINGEVSPGMAKQEIKDLTKQFEKDHVGIFVVFVFLNAYLVAALVEELSKYFGFWMLEHPDLMDAKDIVFLTEDGQEINTNNRTLQSRGAAITIAMVAVATGFACAENLLYVFVYTPPSVTNELVTLVTRSLFPLHPLLAAIQSIGVVQRDLESNRKSQLGRIVFPAVLLHGSFDFVLMIMALLDGANQPAATTGTNSTTGTYSNTDDKDDTIHVDDGIPMTETIISVAMSVGFMVAGFFYYYCASKSQRLRLIELEQGNQGGSEMLV